MRIYDDGRPDLPSIPDEHYGCCWGSTMRDDCDCWEPVYDLEQSEPKPEVMPMPRPRMCEDCAFRPDSPERTGDETYHPSDLLMEGRINPNRPFYCHQGMRLPLKWVHPCGLEAEGHPGNYSPPILDVGGYEVPFKVDGTPGDICAGWFARYCRQLLANAPIEEP